MEIIASTLIRPVNGETMGNIAMATSNFQRMPQDIWSMNRASGRMANRNYRDNILSSNSTYERLKHAIANRNPFPPYVRAKICRWRLITIR